MPKKVMLICLGAASCVFGVTGAVLIIDGRLAAAAGVWGIALISSFAFAMISTSDD